VRALAEMADAVTTYLMAAIWRGQTQVLAIGLLALLVVWPAAFSIAGAFSPFHLSRALAAVLLAGAAAVQRPSTVPAFLVLAPADSGLSKFSPRRHCIACAASRRH
jgi:hypothetical protein